MTSGKSQDVFLRDTLLFRVNKLNEKLQTYLQLLDTHWKKEEEVVSVFEIAPRVVLIPPEILVIKQNRGKEKEYILCQNKDEVEEVFWELYQLASYLISQFSDRVVITEHCPNTACAYFSLLFDSVFKLDFDKKNVRAILRGTKCSTFSSDDPLIQKQLIMKLFNENSSVFKSRMTYAGQIQSEFSKTIPLFCDDNQYLGELIFHFDSRQFILRFREGPSSETESYLYSMDFFNYDIIQFIDPRKEYAVFEHFVNRKTPVLNNKETILLLDAIRRLENSPETALLKKNYVMLHDIISTIVYSVEELYQLQNTLNWEVPLGVSAFPMMRKSTRKVIIGRERSSFAMFFE